MKQKADKFKFDREPAGLPATQGMLHLVRSELKAEMRAGFSNVDARFNQVDARFNKVDARFDEVRVEFSKVYAELNKMNARFNKIDARFNEMDGKFNGLNSKFELVLSEVHRIGLMVEEQNSRNTVVLEGLTGLFRRQEHLESQTNEMQNTLSLLARSRA